MHSYCVLFVINFINLAIMEGNAKQEEAMQGLILHCSKQRTKGVDDFEIAQELIDSGVESRLANKIVESSKHMEYTKPNRTKPLLGMLAGLVVAGVGIGITMGSNGQVIAYGAIVVGILWFFKGIIAFFEASLVD